MTREEAKSCTGTIEMLQRLAYNIHGVMDVIDADNCKKIIKALEQETVSKESYDHEYFLRKEFEIKIAELKQQELKIRKEIIAEILFHSGTGDEVIQAYVDGLNKGLKIIDKYKEEVKD